MEKVEIKNVNSFGGVRDAIKNVNYLLIRGGCKSINLYK